MPINKSYGSFDSTDNDMDSNCNHHSKNHTNFLEPPSDEHRQSFANRMIVSSPVAWTVVSSNFSLQNSSR